MAVHFSLVLSSKVYHAFAFAISRRASGLMNLPFIFFSSYKNIGAFFIDLIEIKDFDQ